MTLFMGGLVVAGLRLRERGCMIAH